MGQIKSDYISDPSTVNLTGFKVVNQTLGGFANSQSVILTRYKSHLTWFVRKIHTQQT